MMNVDVPIIGDFHYNGHKLLSEYQDCARALAKYRINPGNVGKGSKHDSQFAIMIEQALRWAKPVRIGVNWGSLDQELLASLGYSDGDVATAAAGAGPAGGLRAEGRGRGEGRGGGRGIGGLDTGGEPIVLTAA